MAPPLHTAETHTSLDAGTTGDSSATLHLHVDSYFASHPLDAKREICCACLEAYQAQLDASVARDAEAERAAIAAEALLADSLGIVIAVQARPSQLTESLRLKSRCSSPPPWHLAQPQQAGTIR